MRQRACKPGFVGHLHYEVRSCTTRDDDCAAIPLGSGSLRPSSNQPGRRAGTRPICRPYSVLHPVGFTVPALSPGPRCALAAPFRPYPAEARRYAFCGTVPDPEGPPGITRHRGSMEPGLSSSEQAPPRPPGPLAKAHMDYCGRGSNKASSLARHSPSITPSMRSGRKRRWKAITAFCGSVTS
jgi:hypothetical protein